jgi:IS30 family transposase
MQRMQALAQEVEAAHDEQFSLTNPDARSMATSGKGKERIVNARFAAMCSHYLIDAHFCNVAAGWGKGRVEKDVQDNRRGLSQEMLTESSASFAELNTWLAARCPKAWAVASHPDCPNMSVAEAHEHE